MLVFSLEEMDAATAAALLSEAVAGSEAPASGSTPQGFPENLGVYVGNLPEEVQPEEIYDHFKCPACIDARAQLLGALAIHPKKGQ